MDPLSITVSIVTLIQISAQVTVLVKQFRDEVSVVDTTLNGILNDVDGFQQVLQSMKETFAQEEIQADVHATGHVGSHWKNLARSLSDGEGTLDQLRSLLTSVSKSTSFLDATRKQLRLKSAVTQISGFREQIQSYRAALQLSLSTVIVWNQVTLQKSTAKLPDRMIPNLNKLYDEIRNLGTDLNTKIGRLESTVVNQGFHAESELISLTNLKECVESAADVVSTASTTLGPEGSEKASVKHGSEFGDVFKKESNETMQRWISSNTVYEFDDVEAPTLDPSETSTGDAPTVYESDSDSDIENELVRVLFSDGKKRKEQGDLHGAERHLRNCLSRFPSTTSYTSLASSQSTSITGVSKAELLELLTETYCLQGAWTQAKSTMKEKLAVTERQTGNKSERFLWDSFRLCEVLMNTKDYTEAQLHGRKSLKGFRRMRESGHDGYEKSLILLIQLCKEEGNLEDEEAYAALLGSHRANFETRNSASGIGVNTGHDLASSLESARPQDLVPTECLERIPKDLSLPTPRHVSRQSNSPEARVPLPQTDSQRFDLQDRGKTSRSTLSTSSSTLDNFTPKASDVRQAPTLGRTRVQESLVASSSELASTSKGRGPQVGRLTPITTLETLRCENHLSRSSAADTQEGQSLKRQPIHSPVRSLTSDEFVLRTTNKKPNSGGSDTTPKATPAHQNVLGNAKTSDKGNISSYTKLLITLCQQELGRKPVFMIGRGREGYNCIVFADESQRNEIGRVTGCETREEARHNAASKAYKTIVSLSAQSEPETPKSNVPDEVPDLPANLSSSVAPTQAQVDPPAYTPNEAPSNLSSPVEFLQSIPEILVSPTVNDTSFSSTMSGDTAHSFPVRRAASDSRIPWQKNSNAVRSLNLAKSSAENLRRSYQAAADLNTSTHRRAASTSARLPEWKTGGHGVLAHPSEMGISSPLAKMALHDDRRPTIAPPGVTFDSIESSIERPGHSNPDPATTPSSRSFSLFPTSLSKTFSLQERRSKSEDPSLTKKKSLRFALMGSSSKRKSPTTTSHEFEDSGNTQASVSSRVCPVCAASLHDLSEDKAWSHVNSCRGKSSPQTIEIAYELPALGPSSFPVELPASPAPSTLYESRFEGTILPRSPVQDPGALSDLHRAFSKRNLSANKFEVEDEVSVPVRPAVSFSSRPEWNPLQRQVLLLGDARCGKTWLSSAWCDGGIPKRTSRSATIFTRQLGGLEVIIQDHSGLDFVHNHIRRASYGVVHAVLLCFDIGSPQSFDNVEHRWNHEADLYLKDVPKVLVGCKKDINRGGSQTVWTRDAYKLTARISARAYFETSAVTMEGLDVLFNNVAQIVPR